MNSSTEWSPTTIQYRLNLPHALHSISPALSALHAARAATLHPETSAILHPSHCPKCGTYYFSGDHSTYLVGPSAKKTRKRATSSRTRSLQRRCHLCGFLTDACTSPSHNHSSVPIQSPSGPSKLETVPTIPQTKEIGQESPPTDILPPVGVPVPPSTGRQSQPKSCHPKTSTLKDMLSRDRQREQVVKARKRKEGHEGLSSFLKEL
ncbi:hypothetical protein J3R82DRAFT_4530 [Butyriboletus roseoflavus]|nr:hypothetical protein J3R82DRAFT_4530 [Butyriboletus roseoflavus]